MRPLLSGASSFTAMYFARSSNDVGNRQLLSDHLRNVGRLSGQFAEEIGLPHEMGEWAGWLHDLGKYSDEFQRHLLNEDRLLVEHAAHGAAIAAAAGSIECAFAVDAHHKGLETGAKVRELLTREELTAGLPPGTTVRSRAVQFLELAAKEFGLSGGPPRTMGRRGDEATLELRTRMLLSCLVDADRLDAEAWMGSWKPGLRAEVETLDASVRLERTLEHIEKIAATKSASPVGEARGQVLRDALAQAEAMPGFFSLTVPTGGGKTLASLAFSLKHAARHGHRRLIFVLPFLTIIEQNSGVIREAVGEGTANAGRVVLEHHSNVVFERDDNSQAADEVRQRLLAENWDAPIVVTTAVQILESLFAARPSAVRKIHNVARSVIVFDEAQTFPPGMLRPIVAMLRQLVDEYGCSVIFSTATQPALSQDIRGQGGLEPLLPRGTVREIASDPAALFDKLKRVDVAWPGPAATPMAEVAAEMAAARRALAIVNTKQQARELFEALRSREPGAVHLSTRMCAAHRRAVLEVIRQRLIAAEDCLVVSTQLVEAGVDIDFPAVWRALGPLEGIAQAAGRCNREGRLPVGRVTVFRTEDGKLPGGAYRAATDITEQLLKSGEVPALDDPATFGNYFVSLYNVRNLDERDVAGSRRALDFPATAARFRIIDDATTGVLVPYGEGAVWVERVLAGEELGRGEIRRLQPFIVGLYRRELEAALASGEVVLREQSGLHVFRGHYDDALGLVLTGGALED
jgi:CRISPR-associated endonuclease/helicase Cas3